MLRAACLSAALLACAPALAQNYAGTYTATNASGGTVMLTLAQDAQSGVSGTLTGYASFLASNTRPQRSIVRRSIGNSSQRSMAMAMVPMIKQPPMMTSERLYSAAPKIITDR